MNFENFKLLLSSYTNLTSYEPANKIFEYHTTSMLILAIKGEYETTLQDNAKIMTFI